MSQYVIEQPLGAVRRRKKSARAKAVNSARARQGLPPVPAPKAPPRKVPAKKARPKEWREMNAKLRSLPGLTQAISALPPPFTPAEIRKMKAEPLLFFELAGDAAKKALIRFLDNSRKHAGNPSTVKVYYPFSSKYKTVRVELSYRSNPVDIMSALLAMSQKYPGETALGLGETIVSYGGEGLDWIRRGVEKTGKNIEKGIRDTAEAVSKTAQDMAKGAGNLLKNVWPFGQYEMELGTAAAGVDWAVLLTAIGTILTATAALAAPIIDLIKGMVTPPEVQAAQAQAAAKAQANTDALQQRADAMNAERQAQAQAQAQAAASGPPPALILGGLAAGAGLLFFILKGRK